MNKNQRKVLNKCAEQLEQMESKISSIVELIEGIRDDEECKLDNLPESLRDSSKGEEIEECIEQLDEILSLLEDREYENAINLLSEF